MTALAVAGIQRLFGQAAPFTHGGVRRSPGSRILRAGAEGEDGAVAGYRCIAVKVRENVQHKIRIG